MSLLSAISGYQNKLKFNRINPAKLMVPSKVALHIRRNTCFVFASTGIQNKFNLMSPGEIFDYVYTMHAGSEIVYRS